MIDERVLAWVREAPFSDPELIRLRPNFCYEDWFDRGRAIPGAVEALIELLEQEDLDRPSGDGKRVAYALGWIGDKGKRAIDALHRANGSKDITLRIEAVAALGRLGDSGVLPTLERMLTDEKDDLNVRANACISIGRLRVPSSERLLRDTLKNNNKFLVRCAEKRSVYTPLSHQKATRTKRRNEERSNDPLKPTAKRLGK